MKNYDVNIFLKKFFFEKPLFLVIVDQKFDKSSEPEKLNRRRDACNSMESNLKWHWKFFIFFYRLTYLHLSQQANNIHATFEWF